MKHDNHQRGIALLLGLVAIQFSSCSPAEFTRGIALDKVVAEARTRAQQTVRQNPRVFSAVDVRGENGDTLVVDYTVTAEAAPRVAEMHDEYLNGLRNNETHRKDFLRVADLGISARVIYRNQAGAILLDETVTKDSL